nr:MAG TPA: hypothetical protein [Caudoviricetes sp.]
MSTLFIFVAPVTVYGIATALAILIVSTIILLFRKHK